MLSKDDAALRTVTTKSTARNAIHLLNVISLPFARSGVTWHGLAHDHPRAEADMAAFMRARHQVLSGSRTHTTTFAWRPL